VSPPSAGSWAGSAVTDLVISGWIAARVPARTGRRAVAVDGKTVRGARPASDAAEPDGPGRHLLAVLDHDARVVLGQGAVQAKTSEIDRFAPRLDSLDRNEVVVTAAALHTQRTPVDYLASQLIRRIRPLQHPHRWHPETGYAITDLDPHQARPDQLATWIRGH
jgi:hypothetical protein